MSNFLVYDKDDRVQVMDRPYDMILIKKSEVAEVDLRPVSQGSSFYAANHYAPNRYCVVAWKPRTEAKYRNKTHSTYFHNNGGYPLGRTQIVVNPMDLYYYSWDYEDAFQREDYGMEIFNEAGDLTWASYHTSMNILDTIIIEDIRQSSEDLWNLFSKNYGHTNVAVIPVANPYFQSGRQFLWFRWCFDEYDNLKIFLKVHITLTNDEIDMGVFLASPSFRLAFIVVDLSNTVNFVNVEGA